MGGSIRLPASHCGLVGLKPSRGRTTLAPRLGEFWGPLTHEHVLTRSVRDSAAILDATHGPAPGDPYTAPPPNGPWLDDVARDPGHLRIGRVEPVPGLEVDDACWTAVEMTAGVCVERGHRVEPIQLPQLERPDEGPWMLSGVARELDRVGEWLGRPIEREDVEPSTWLIAELGRGLDAARHVALADRCWSWVRALCEAWYGRFDALLLPVTVAPAPPLGRLAPDAELGALMAEMVRHTRFTMPFDLTGEPAIALPVHETVSGLPVGAQLVAPLGREDLLFQLAGQVEAELDFEARRPA
jgi:amidase